MPTTIPPTERLLDLVIALVNTPNRMTKAQIRRSVAGYDGAPSVEAFERMFERDKDALRELGIPIETVTDAAHGDDVGYRVDLDAYALPPIELTPAQHGVLSLAARFWQDHSLARDASRALTKLSAVTSGPGSEESVAVLAPRARAGGDAFLPLLDAIQYAQAVTFGYRAASTGEERVRTVEPWRLVASRGGWYLVGRDRDRAEARAFRLTRMTSATTTVGPRRAFVVPSDLDPRALIDSHHGGAEQLAVLAVRPERAGALRARAVPPTDGTGPADARFAAIAESSGRDLLRVPYRAVTRMAEELSAYGDAALVLAPTELRTAVLQRLGAAARLSALADRPAGEASDG
jgi:proteasome accessory factor B